MLATQARFAIDPKLILVIELNRKVSAEAWRTADLVELEAIGRGAVVAFSSDPQLGAFLERLAKHRAAEPSEKDHLFGADLFDAVESIRRYGREDRLAKRLVEALDGGADATVAADVELWHPGDDVERAEQWRLDVEAAVSGADDGAVVDRFVDHDNGIMLLRVRASAELIADFAEIDEIATIDLVPQAPETLRSAPDADLGDVPPWEPPAADAPLVAIVDSGVNSSHPLIDGALYLATSLLPELADGADDHGHGTAVAGLALHGPAEIYLEQGVMARPFGRLLSLRVLDEANRFPEGVLFEKAAAAAVRRAAQLGARVINLSVGDPAEPLKRRRATPVASVLDALARELDVVIVVPVGNTSPADYMTADREGAEAYVHRGLESENAALIDPAPAAIPLTVGGTGQSVALPKVGDLVLGGDQQPSAISRHGPGIGRAIKPELVGPSGTLAWSTANRYVERPRQLARVLCSHDPTAIFRQGIGTSFAAPVVTRVATAVIAENPSIKSGALVRALVLQSAEGLPVDSAHLPPGGPAEVAANHRHLLGHGAPRLREAVGSSASRVVFVAEGVLQVDYVVLYAVPLPHSFFATGGKRRMTLGLAFNPLTRFKRQDYLGSRLYPYLFHGADADKVAARLVEADSAELASGSLKDLDPYRLNMSPSATASSESANIFGVWERSQKLDGARGDVAILAVRSSRRWVPETTEDRIGVALAVEHEGQPVDLHAELSLRVPIEVELRA